MALNTSTSFPPIGPGPYRIDREWCIGDSLNYININSTIFDSRTIDLCTLLFAVSSFSVNLSGKASSTIDINFDIFRNTLSAEVINNSIDTTKLGGNILQAGKALLTAVSLSALRDLNLSNIQGGQALVWDTNTNTWRNQTLVTGSAAIANGLYGDVRVTNNGATWTLNTDSGFEAVQTANIRTGAVTPTKLSTGAPTWTTTGNVGIGVAIPTDTLHVAGNIRSNTGKFVGGESNDYIVLSAEDDSFSFFANNIERFRITSTGNVGIGTSTPTYKLTLSGTGNVVGLDNGAIILAKNTLGTYDSVFIPRYIDNGTYLTYGFNGLTIRNNNSATTIRALSSGQVGLGVATPLERLHVSGNAQLEGNTTKIIFNNTGATANNRTWLYSTSSNSLYWQALNDTGGGGGNLFQMIRSGNSISSFDGTNDGSVWFTINNDNKRVGVDTATPTQPLDVVGNMRTTGGVIINSASPTVFLQDTDHRSAMLHCNNNTFYVLRGSDTNSNNWTTLLNGQWPLQINLESGDIFTGATLTIHGRNVNQPVGSGADCSVFLRGSSEGGKYIRFQNDTSVAQDRSNNVNRWIIGSSSTPETGSNTGSDFIIYRYNDAGDYVNTPFSIARGSGNISAPGTITAGGFSGPLTGSVTGTASLATNLAGGAQYRIPYQTAANTTAFITTGTTGQVLTYTASGPAWQAAAVPIGSTTNLQINSLGVGTAASTTAGEIRATNNITAYFTSDIRLKENIQPISNALNKVQQIAGVEYDWTDEYIQSQGGEDGYFVRKHDVGVIAQEVEKVLPEVVAERESGFKAVKYERIIALLIEAVKELTIKVNNLENK